MPRETTTKRDKSSVKATLPAGLLSPARLHHVSASQVHRALRRHSRAFTLAELVVTVGVLALLVLLATQLLKSAATVTTLGHKQMDADAQARQLLDRMAVDFAQMVKRRDVDYYVKSSAPFPLRSVTQSGNDQIAFYSAVPGYYPSAGSQSPVSLVAYRINSSLASDSYTKMERLGRGLVWNAVSTTDTPVVFMPIPVASPLPIGDLPVPPPNPIPTPAWPEARSATTVWSNSEAIGPQVFRFEYYYLLTSGKFSTIPWDPQATPPHTSIAGLQDVSAIVVDIAMIDPKSGALVTNCQLAKLNGSPPPPSCSQQLILVDYAAGMTPGQLLRQWSAALDANIYPNGIGLPAPARAGIKLYERAIYLSPPVQ